MYTAQVIRSLARPLLRQMPVCQYRSFQDGRVFASSSKTPKSSFDSWIAEADKYYQTAAWEEASKALDVAETLAVDGCVEGRVQIQLRRGEIERRKGNYGKAIQFLEEAERSNDGELEHLEIIGELGAVHVNEDAFYKSRDLFCRQYKKARALLANGGTVYFDRDLAVSIEAQACRAIGNLGLATYHIATTAPVRRKPLLYKAIEQLEERVTRAEALEANLLKNGKVGDYLFLSRSWQALGLGRLTLCYTALGEHAQALQYGKATVRLAGSSPDPVIRGVARFYYGYALLEADMPDEARRQWNFSSATDLCTSAIAVCKEPSEEHCRYLRRMRELKVCFDHYDGYGYSALDYSVLAGHEKLSAIVLRGLRDEMDSRYPEDEAQADKQVDARQVEAERRKQYRAIFQSKLLPLLAAHEPDKSSEQRLVGIRMKYADELKMDLHKREVFDNFRFIPYSAFKKLGRLPRPSSRADMEHLYELASDSPATELNGASEAPYVVFFSYEWKGKDNGLGDPDDSMNSQYKRMIDALECLLRTSDSTRGTTNLVEERLFIWLDVASIDQTNQAPGAQDRGVSALPLVIALCNTMISLVDETYFNRAWCAVEVLLMQRLLGYGQHRHLEHRLHTPGDVKGSLIPSSSLSKVEDVATNDAKYGLTDVHHRASIRFLARQSELSIPSQLGEIVSLPDQQVTR